MATNKLKKILFRVAALVAGLLCLVLFLELIFLFLPVDEGLATVPVTRENPVLHFEPDRESTWSRGWRFNIVNQVRTNNYGFVHDHSYDSSSSTPLLAVIGDSYIEAAMVPFQETGVGRLWQAADGAGRVYSFASSGSPLSQYLVYAEYARDHFRPDGLVIVVVGNDFDESILRAGAPAGFHYFQKSSANEQPLELVDFRPGLLRRAARLSSLARYLVTHLETTALPGRLKARLGGGNQQAFTGNTARDHSEERIALSMAVIDQFLMLLPDASGLPADRIILAVDGIRPELYDQASLKEAEQSYFGVMRKAFMARATEARFPVLDMQPLFQADFATHGSTFEFESDAHWNKEGHRVFAEAVQSSNVWRDLFGPEGTTP